MFWVAEERRTIVEILSKKGTFDTDEDELSIFSDINSDDNSWGDFSEVDALSEGDSIIDVSTEDNFNEASWNQKKDDVTAVTDSHSTDDSASAPDTVLSPGDDSDSVSVSSLASASVSVTSATVTISTSDRVVHRSTN